jgi:hypothetical protein
LVDLVKKVCETFRVRPVYGTLVSLAKRFVPNSGLKTISFDDQGFNDSNFTVEPDDVFVVNFMMTSGDGRPLEEQDIRPTVLQRNVHTSSSVLKLKSGKQAFAAFSTQHGVFPFSLRYVL